MMMHRATAIHWLKHETVLLELWLHGRVSFTCRGLGEKNLIGVHEDDQSSRAVGFEQCRFGTEGCRWYLAEEELDVIMWQSRSVYAARLDGKRWRLPSGRHGPKEKKKKKKERDFNKGMATIMEKRDKKIMNTSVC